MAVAKKAQTETDEAGEKRCASCREVKPRSAMLRFVTGTDGKVLFDPRERAPGRGIRVCANRTCLKKKKLWNRELETSIENWLMDQLGIYMRQHRIILGADATKNAVGLGEVAVVLVAGDAAERTQRNVSDVVSKTNETRGEAAEWVKQMKELAEQQTRDNRDGERKHKAPREVSLVFLTSTMQRLGRALGRDEVGVVALAKTAGASMKDGSLVARAALLASKSSTGEVG